MKKLVRALAASVVAGVVAVSLSLPGPAAAQQKVLRFIPQADLRILDPIATTAYITRNHGYMVYDTLLAMDALGRGGAAWVMPQINLWRRHQEPRQKMMRSALERVAGTAGISRGLREVVEGALQ